MSCGQCYKCLEGKTERIGRRDWPAVDLRMVVCVTCGNKRCPHATDCVHACSGSNEPGQKGSHWELKEHLKHTPGPWRFDECGEVVGGKYGSPVCELPPASMLAGSITEHSANARLITAAPDLLEALAMVRDYIVAMKGEGHDYSLIIDAALNKAGAV